MTRWYYLRSSVHNSGKPGYGYRYLGRGSMFMRNIGTESSFHLSKFIRPPFSVYMCRSCLQRQRSSCSFLYSKRLYPQFLCSTRRELLL